MDSFFTRYKIEDRSYVAFLKREIHSRSLAAGFDEVQTGKIDIIVSELTSNLIKHAGEGELLYRIRDREPEASPLFEILCIDRGPGIEDTARAMKDGVSTTNTLGQGLGAIDRLSSFFQIFSMPKWGTILYSRHGERYKTADQRMGLGMDVAAVCVPKPLEEVCGDGYAVKQSNGVVKLFLGDGLGHGPHARYAMDTAIDVFMNCEYDDPVGIIRAMHDGARRTRGLVACVAVLDRAASKWHFCGVGNISTRLYTGIEYRNYMSYNGTVGLTIPRAMNATTLAVERNQHLVMCSDGIQTRWEINRFHSIFKYDLALMASALYKDFSRGNDDASVLVAKVI